MQEKVLDIRRRVLGEEHPDTLTSMNNLALTLQAQGDLPGARDLQEKTLDIRRRVLGGEHPDTSISAFNLFVTLLGMQETAAAHAVYREHLAWLTDRDPAGLGANQRNIRGQLIEYLTPRSRAARGNEEKPHHGMVASLLTSHLCNNGHGALRTVKMLTIFRLCCTWWLSVTTG